LLDVEEISEKPQRPVVPPPPTSLYSNDFPTNDEDPWSNPSSYQAPSYQQQQQQQQNQQDRYDIANDDYDSDFDDDDYPSPQSNPNTRFASSIPHASNLQPVQRDDDSHSMASTAMNRKSSKIFSKSSDSYIMGSATPAVSESDQVHIYLNERGFYYWMPNNNKYTVTVTSPKMESKFKGIKKFIAYQLQSSFSPEPVSRRYKNFDWLHERLSEKFVLIPIPPLPDKQISGRYEEQFIEHRRAQLQRK
jgi:sorting nexin-9/18/33